MEVFPFDPTDLMTQPQIPFRSVADVPPGSPFVRSFGEKGEAPPSPAQKSADEARSNKDHEGIEP